MAFGSAWEVVGDQHAPIMGSYGMRPLLAPVPPAPLPRTLTYSVELRSKLWINGPAIVMGLHPSALAGPQDYGRYWAFWLATKRKFLDTAATDAFPAPGTVLDARILGQGFARWKCQQGRANPFAGAAWPGAAVGGFELPPAIFGVANPVAIRNSINVVGTWGMVTSGRPNLLLEPAFQSVFPRLRRNIWNKVVTTVTCNLANATSALAYTGTRSAFPNHRVWRRTPIGAANSALRLTAAQGPFTRLWQLAPVPAP